MGLFDKFKKKEKMYLYTEEELKEYEKYIKEQFGNYDEVIHEVISLDIHLDIIVVPPTKEENYYKLITMGMGAYKMNVPRELKKYELERAELVLYLPPTWDIKSNKEEDYWPIRQLKTLARLPIQNKTWLGIGHTISSDAKNTPYASNTKLCSMLLLLASNSKYELLSTRIGKNKKINFYQLFPIYEEELIYKNINGFESLLELIPEEDLLPINIKRKKYCVKKKNN